MLATAVVVYPPNAKAAVCVPAPPKSCLAVFKLPPVDHAPTGPFTVNCSEALVEPDCPGGVCPKYAIAEVLSVAPPERPCQPVDISAISVQAVPFHDSHN